MVLWRKPLNDVKIFSRVCFVVAAFLGVLCYARNDQIIRFFRNSIPSECCWRPESSLRRRAFLLSYFRCSWCYVFVRTAFKIRVPRIWRLISALDLMKQGNKAWKRRERRDSLCQMADVRWQQNTRAFHICKQLTSHVRSNFSRVGAIASHPSHVFQFLIPGLVVLNVGGRALPYS